MTTPFGRQYLNMYLNQGNLFGTGYSSNYSCGSEIASLAMGITTSIFSAALMNKMSNASNVGGGGSSYATDIQELKEDKANAEKIVDKEQPTLKQNISKAEADLSNYKTLSTEVTNLENSNKKLEGQKKTLTGNESEEEKARIEKENKNIDAQIEANNKLIAEKNAKMNALGLSLDDVKNKVQEAKDARTEAIEDFKTNIDKQIQEIQEAQNGDSAELTKFNSAEKLLSPKRKAVGNFASAAKAYESAIQPGKNIEGAKNAAKDLIAAYDKIQDIKTDNDKIANGISSAFRYYETHSAEINAIATEPNSYFELEEDKKTIKSAKQ